MRRVLATLGGVAALSSGQAAMAQDDGWDVRSDPAHELVQANLQFEDGPGLIVHCLAGELNVIVVDLPPDIEAAERGQRALETGFRNEPLASRWWHVGPEARSAFNSGPAQLARRFRNGGVYSVRVPGANGQPAVRTDITLPSDSSGIDTVLTACGRLTVDPRDDMPEAEGLVDMTVPLNSRSGSRFPTSGRNPGQVSITCIVAPQGRVEDCRVEFETPPGAGIGRQILRQESRIRVQFEDEAAQVGRVINIVVTQG